MTRLRRSLKKSLMVLTDPETMTTFEEFKSILNLITNKVCWTIIGPSYGGCFSMHIGEKIRRPTPILRNDALTPDQQNYEGEYCLLFTQIGWGIFKDGVEICDSNSSSTPEGTMSKTFPLLCGKTITKLRIGSTPDRLTITLSDGYEIKARAWTTDKEDECYIFYIRDEKSYGVYVSGEIKVETASK